MKRNILMMSLLTTLLGGLCGCGFFAKMPTGALLELEYSTQGSRGGTDFQAEVKKLENGDMVLRAMQKERGPLMEKTLTAEELQGFVQIIEEEKMYKYKERYNPIFDVKDGRSWTFRARFEDDYISSHGYAASPSGDGLERIKDYSKKLVEHGAQLVEEQPEE